MKKILCIMALLAAIACTPITPQTTNITIANVLQEFDKIDAELNTSWRAERIPDQMIPPAALEPAVKQVMFLNDRVAKQNDSATRLADARISMLKAQAATYDMHRIKEQAEIDMIVDVVDPKRGTSYNATEKIDCKNVQAIAKYYGLYDVSQKEWIKFVNIMDELLKDKTLQREIGVNENRPKFYDSELQDANGKINAAVKAVKQQCDVEIVIR